MHQKRRLTADKNVIGGYWKSRERSGVRVQCLSGPAIYKKAACAIQKWPNRMIHEQRSRVAERGPPAFPEPGLLPCVVLLENLHEIDGHGQGGFPLFVLIGSDSLSDHTSRQPCFLPRFIERRFCVRISGIDEPLRDPPRLGTLSPNETNLEVPTSAPNGYRRCLLRETHIPCDTQR